MNPGLHQFNETRNVLMYVHRASRVVVEDAPKKHVGNEEGDDDDEDEVEKEGKRQQEDPMEGDVFDSEEVQNRRCEMVETTSFGSIFAR